jgi:hypothetical protein
MSSKRAPRNTSRESEDNPLAFLADAMAVGSSQSILNQEAQGQRSLVDSDTLPTKMGQYSQFDAKPILEAAGVRFLGEVQGDPLFQYVELPDGWKKVATDHSMWSKLIDEKGRERAAIFYKAAFYDRSASLSLTCRFSYSFDYDRRDSDHVGVANVTDCGKVIHATEPITEHVEERWRTSEEAGALAVKWLDEHYPEWRNPAAYWD